MSEMIPTPAFEELLRAACQPPAADPAFVARLRSQLITRSTSMNTPRRFVLRPAWTLALVVLFVLLLTGFVIGPQQVLAAVRALFGYIPGIGLVSQDAPVRVLEQPASLTRGGVTVSVSQAVLDAVHTTLVYQVDGLPANSRFTPRPGVPTDPSMCYQTPELRLPDGKLLEVAQSFDSRDWVSGYGERLSFLALPANLDDVVFFMPCIGTTLPGTTPTDWQIPLHFIPAPPQMTVYPVIDVATPTPAPSPSVLAPQASPSASAGLVFPYGISLALDHVVPLADGYLLQASLTWTGDQLVVSPPGDDPQARLLDADGQEIQIGPSPSDQPYAPDTKHYFMDFKTAPIYTDGPLTFSVDSIAVDLNTKTTFTFDPGENPKPGQTWELNRDLQVAGYPLRVISAHMVSDNPGETGYSFDMESSNGILSAMLNDLEHPTASGGGGGSPGNFSFGFNYDGQPPAGPITVTVTSITIRLPGPWQVTWTPPAGSAARFATPTPPSSSACQPLTTGAWNKLLAHPGPLPPGLTGKLGFDSWIQNGQFTPWNAAIANVDGSDIRRLGEGNSAVFSPDGSRVLYTTQVGDAIQDLAGGATTVLPGGAHGQGLTWSPDGKELAYMAGGTPFDLFVMNADGSNVRQVTRTPADETLVGWLPDGSGLAFQQDGPNGSALWSIDLKTAARKRLFGPNRTIFSYSLSPDGRRVATNERLFGDNDDELYIYNLDGSGRRLVANLMPLMLSSPAWSPDGHWLAVTVTAPDQPGQINTPIIALLGLDTCQVIPLPALQGNITAWGR